MLFFYIQAFLLPEDEVMEVLILFLVSHPYIEFYQIPEFLDCQVNIFKDTIASKEVWPQICDPTCPFLFILYWWKLSLNSSLVFIDSLPLFDFRTKIKAQNGSYFKSWLKTPPNPLVVNMMIYILFVHHLGINIWQLRISA